MNTWRILHGDVRGKLAELPDRCAQTCVTSPPYFGLRDYGASGQIGLEVSPEEYVDAMVAVFAEVRRVLRDNGTLWLNLGDSYATQPGKGSNVPQTKWKANKYPEDAAHRSQSLIGLKPKDLVGIPWRVAFALQADGWYLRSDIIWSKPNPMPESVTDRPTKAHEYIFLLSKSARYYYDADAIKEPYAESTIRELQEAYDGKGRKDYAGAGVQNPSDVKRRIVEGAIRKNEASGDRRRVAVNEWDKRNNDRVIAQNNLRRNALAAGDTRQDYNFQTGMGRNKRSVWTVTTQPYPDAHFATYPEDLIEPCILAGSRTGDTVLDPFTGSGTTGAVAIRHQRNFIGCELNADYIALAQRRIGAVAPLFSQEQPA